MIAITTTTKHHSKQARRMNIDVVRMKIFFRRKSPQYMPSMERQQTNEPSHNNVGGAIVGGILGGVLGHQIGGGSGRDIATAGGAVAGAVLGSNVGDNSGSHNSRDVQRCQTVPNREPDSWDVTYSFRGYEHHIQTRYAPGSTISVNHNGEPRQ